MTDFVPMGLVQDRRCHCGNVTSGGLWRQDPPTRDSRKPCCILCRCDEHGFGTAPRAGYRPTDELPGCGPLCIYHPESTRLQRMKQAEQRAADVERWMERSAALDTLATELLGHDLDVLEVEA